METPTLPLARPGLAKPCAFLKTADLALLGGNALGESESSTRHCGRDAPVLVNTPTSGAEPWTVTVGRRTRGRKVLPTALN